MTVRVALGPAIKSRGGRVLASAARSVGGLGHWPPGSPSATHRLFRRLDREVSGEGGVLPKALPLPGLTGQSTDQAGGGGWRVCLAGRKFLKKGQKLIPGPLGGLILFPMPPAIGQSGPSGCWAGGRMPWSLVTTAQQGHGPDPSSVPEGNGLRRYGGDGSAGACVLTRPGGSRVSYEGQTGSKAALGRATG